MGGHRHQHRDQRGGSLFVEFLVATVIFSLVLVALIETFTVGVRQTRTVKSYASAQGVADWAIADARAWIAAGIAEEEDDVALTADARRELPGLGTQLAELEVLRTMTRMPGSGKLFTIEVRVGWREPGSPEPRGLSLAALERGQL